MPWIATSRRSEGAVSISSAGSNFQVALATRGDFQLSTETIALASRIIANGPSKRSWSEFMLARTAYRSGSSPDILELPFA